MRRRILAKLVSASAVTVALGAGIASSAQAYWDLADFNLTETAKAYPNDSNPHFFGISQGVVVYRWLDDPNHTTVISTNYPGDLTLIGVKEIAAHDTSYNSIGGFGPGNAGSFIVRGRVAIGAGSMVNHDARVDIQAA